MAIKKMFRPAAIAILLTAPMVCTGRSLAQQPADADATPMPATTPAPVELKLVKAGCEEFSKKDNAWEPKEFCRLGDAIVLTFSNLAEWQNDPTMKGNDPASLLLVLNGRVMKGLFAYGLANASSGAGAATPTGANSTAQSAAQPKLMELRYDLKRLDLVQDDKDTSANRDAWNALLGRSKGTIAFEVGVAPGGKLPYVGSQKVTFEVLSGLEVLSSVLIFIALLASFLLLARLTDLLRDAPSDSNGKKMTYSLARCQMAWWFFIVVGGFLYIWLVCGDRDSLTAGVLTLIGISAATGFSSFLVDSSKADQRKALLSEQSDLQTRLEVLSVVQGAIAVDLAAEQQQKQKRLAEVNASLAALPSPVSTSDGLIFDILRDESGISFHRFQMVAWTVILGFVFVVAVYKTLAMPDFSATLLGLMGISAGTYIGFKIPNPPKNTT